MRGEKQMKNFIFKNKVKILLTIFITLLLILLNTNVFATDSTDTSDIIEYTDRFGTARSIIKPSIDTSYGYIIKGHYLFVLLDENAYCYMYPGDSASLYFSGNVQEFTLSNNNIVIDSSAKHNSGGRFGLLSEVLYTSVDIYKGTNKNSVALAGSANFFPVAPEEIPEATTLLEVLEQEQKEKAIMKEVVGLLPVILSVLVSLIALRKALRTLFNFLRTS